MIWYDNCLKCANHTPDHVMYCANHIPHFQGMDQLKTPIIVIVIFIIFRLSDKIHAFN